MNDFKSQNWRTLLTLGLLAGALVLYAGAAGMVAAFHEREVVNDFITLGQLVLLVTPFLTAYTAAARLNDGGASHAAAVGSGVIIGLLTALPSIIMLLFNSEEFRFLLDYSLRLMPFIAASGIAWGMARRGQQPLPNPRRLAFDRRTGRNRDWLAGAHL